MIKTATKIVKQLQDRGFEAYFAGGFVRDKIMGRSSSDIDIATSATPKEVEEIFKHTVDIGKKFGVIIVIENGHSFEITTFRSESNYDDNRRPKSISFTDAKNDSSRRDFTINALFYDPVTNKTIDYIGGVEDIKKRTLRFIGNPSERISEDNLRLIRAIRFKITLNLQYEKNTFNAIRQHSKLIESVASERVRDELNKILVSKNRHTALIELSDSQLLKHILPEVESMKSVPQPVKYHKEGDVFSHTYLALKALPDNSDLRLCWATLLHDVGKPPTIIRKKGRIIFHDHAKISAVISENIMKRLKFSKIDINAVIFLVKNHMKVGQLDKMRPGKKLVFLTNPLIDDLLKLTEADQRGKTPVDTDFIKKLESEISNAKKTKQQMKKEKKEKLIDGNTVIKLGFKKGPIIKEILEDIDDRIADSTIKTKQEAISYIKRKYEN